MDRDDGWNGIGSRAAAIAVLTGRDGNEMWTDGREEAAVADVVDAPTKARSLGWLEGLKWHLSYRCRIYTFPLGLSAGDDVGEVEWGRKR